MPNRPVKFITNNGAGFGSSLYYVTSSWVIRCSGNSNGRTPTTFIRKRRIRYRHGRHAYHVPQVRAVPEEGTHTGHEISSVLTHLSAANPPPDWNAADGVDWATAVREIDAAIEYARRTQHRRASRRVGDTFARD